MQTINEADLHLAPDVLSSLRDGDTVLVERAQQTVALLVPVTLQQGRRPFGLCKGEFIVPADFNDPLPDLEALFDSTR